VKRLAAGIAAAAAAGALFLFWPTDSRRVAARWEKAQGLIEKDGAETRIESFTRVGHLVALFGPGFAVFAAPYEGTITDAQQLAAVVAAYREGAERIEVSDSGREIVVHADRGTADLTTTVEVSGKRGGGPGRERFRVRVAWREDAGEWWIQELEILEVLDAWGLPF
jgi:hypothetical protein